jgi:hypothetical protein
MVARLSRLQNGDCSRFGQPRRNIASLERVQGAQSTKTDGRRQAATGRRFRQPGSLCRRFSAVGSPTDPTIYLNR